MTTWTSLLIFFAVGCLIGLFWAFIQHKWNKQGFYDFWIKPASKASLLKIIFYVAIIPAAILLLAYLESIS